MHIMISHLTYFYCWRQLGPKFILVGDFINFENSLWKANTFIFRNLNRNLISASSPTDISAYTPVELLKVDMNGKLIVYFTLPKRDDKHVFRSFKVGTFNFKHQLCDWIFINSLRGFRLRSATKTPMPMSMQDSCWKLTHHRISRFWRNQLLLLGEYIQIS